MKAEEKAQELIDKFLPLVHARRGLYDSMQEVELYNAKQCAIIAVDEILEAVTTIADKKYDYWQEVKSHLKQ